MRVQIHLRAEKLKNLAKGKWRGKRSSPYCKVVTKSSSTSSNDENSNTVVGLTEVSHGNTSPHFTRSLILEHDEEEAWTHLKITIRDCRRSNKRYADERNSEDCQRIVRRPLLGLSALSITNFNHEEGDDICSDSDPKMGEVEVEIGALLRSEGQETQIELSEGGTLFVSITQSMQGNDMGVLDCHIRGLDVKNIESGLLGLGAVDPYFVVSKKENDTQTGSTRFYDMYRSEPIHDIINPYWKPFQIDLERLCNNDMNKQLRITIYDFEDRGQDRWLGEVFTSVAEMMQRVAKCGNADRETALRVEAVSEDDKVDLRALLVILKADVKMKSFSV
mmetsp:Transcript_27542/g.39448  ORF Transcript_27542/g.39448 Transcript_27542/m.39448 type:complete len:334 (+) Transcript_27542:129-1130(+)|eukprot:CAMPEP_0201704140 /NCGR_PEP_ID=MMETSP0578-20130828/41933_1 /ASSEMBLY_ACC=CAM_ASM_000663 /TAXON_ID=267565 /ORGANISM="Skeletonema grethea, Strain CCMP 1804" /LENGTH=333 /DNA_ID=CAMNT_0048192107 /DNA_START=21 /DNA_END=1022 /DNA_ORIENTATION=+